ncbi:MAG: hypothetical protein K8T25_08540 [Planctomycetia bacterium]|nr:hypothetical protein [Planctomycetia bacterium]
MAVKLGAGDFLWFFTNFLLADRRRSEAAMTTAGRRQRFRVWVVRYADWQPRHWADVPPVAEAIEPAEESPLPADEVGPFLEGFNAAALVEPNRCWAVAVPIEMKYEGDLHSGERFNPAMLGIVSEARNSPPFQGGAGGDTLPCE